jgi:hypothetical protein
VQDLSQISKISCKISARSTKINKSAVCPVLWAREGQIAQVSKWDDGGLLKCCAATRSASLLQFFAISWLLLKILMSVYFRFFSLFISLFSCFLLIIGYIPMLQWCTRHSEYYRGKKYVGREAGLSASKVESSPDLLAAECQHHQNCWSNRQVISHCETCWAPVSTPGNSHCQSGHAHTVHSK